MENNLTARTTKVVSIRRVITLVFFGFMIGFIAWMPLEPKMPNLPWYLLPVLFTLLFGAIAFVWKKDAPAVPTSAASQTDLTQMEWVVWGAGSLANPVISSTVGYYMYNDTYPLKWKRVNLLSIAGLIVDVLLYFLFVRIK